MLSTLLEDGTTKIIPPRSPKSCHRSSIYGGTVSGSYRPQSPALPSPSTQDEKRAKSQSPSFQFRRNSIMRLENILNDGSFDYSVPLRSPSLDAPTMDPEAETRSLHSASAALEDRSAKKKRVKMHHCPECNKGFPRPSGLRTHMNMHTRERPFACNYPGCNRTFSVVSNAKRHMRTHGVLLAGENESASEQYVVGFEEPVVLGPLDPKLNSGSQEPVQLRWLYPTVDGSGRPGSRGITENGYSRQGSEEAPREEEYDCYH